MNLPPWFHKQTPGAFGRGRFAFAGAAGARRGFRRLPYIEDVGAEEELEAAALSAADADPVEASPVAPWVRFARRLVVPVAAIGLVAVIIVLDLPGRFDPPFPIPGMEGRHAIFREAELGPKPCYDYGYNIDGNTEEFSRQLKERLRANGWKEQAWLLFGTPVYSFMSGSSNGGQQKSWGPTVLVELQLGRRYYPSRRSWVPENAAGATVDVYIPLELIRKGSYH